MTRRMINDGEKEQLISILPPSLFPPRLLSNFLSLTLSLSRVFICFNRSPSLHHHLSHTCSLSLTHSRCVKSMLDASCYFISLALVLWNPIWDPFSRVDSPPELTLFSLSRLFSPELWLSVSTSFPLSLPLLCIIRCNHDPLCRSALTLLRGTLMPLVQRLLIPCSSFALERLGKLSAG